MGGAAAVLSGRRRVAAAAIVTAGLAAYYAGVGLLPALPEAADVALIVLVVMPAAFALVWLALPLRSARGLLPVGVALAVLALVLDAAKLDTAANLAKLAAATFLAFALLELFEALWWVVLVATLVPVVDAISVWRGPTRHVLEERPGVFDAFAFAFPVPDGLFQLGLPDVLFFALFLAAAGRWRLRAGWTWLAMVASLGTTLALAVWVDPFGIGGVPALPLLSLAFLAVNSDRLWRGVRAERAAAVAAENEPHDA